jgi:hypothetical protein
MEYFAYEADGIDYQRFKIIYSPKRAILFVAIFVIGLFLFLRSFGFIAFEYNWLSTQGNHQSKSWIEKKRYNEAMTFGKITSNTNDRTSDTKDKDEFWSASINSSPKEDWFSRCVTDSDCLKRAIENELAKNSGNSDFSGLESVEVQSAEMSGGYWIPFFKDGNLSYEVSLNIDSELDKYQGNFSGKIDFIVYGPCSGVHLKKALYEKVAKAVSASIIKDLKE